MWQIAAQDANTFQILRILISFLWELPFLMIVFLFYGRVICEMFPSEVSVLMS